MALGNKVTEPLTLELIIDWMHLKENLVILTEMNIASLSQSFFQNHPFNKVTLYQRKRYSQPGILNCGQFMQKGCMVRVRTYTAKAINRNLS
jgi:hypothetical protein